MTTAMDTLVSATKEQKPTEFLDVVNDIMMGKARDAIQHRQQEVAAALFNSQDAASSDEVQADDASDIDDLSPEEIDALIKEVEAEEEDGANANEKS